MLISMGDGRRGGYWNMIDYISPRSARYKPECKQNMQFKSSSGRTTAYLYNIGDDIIISSSNSGVSECSLQLKFYIDSRTYYNCMDVIMVDYNDSAVGLPVYHGIHLYSNFAERFCYNRLCERGGTTSICTGTCYSEKHQDVEYDISDFTLKRISKNIIEFIGGVHKNDSQSRSRTYTDEDFSKVFKIRVTTEIVDMINSLIFLRTGILYNDTMLDTYSE